MLWTVLLWGCVASTVTERTTHWIAWILGISVGLNKYEYISKKGKTRLMNIPAWNLTHNADVNAVYFLLILKKFRWSLTCFMAGWTRQRRSRSMYHLVGTTGYCAFPLYCALCLSVCAVLHLNNASYRTLFKMHCPVLHTYKYKWLHTYFSAW